MVFNPQIQPTNDPSWLGYSRPISDVQADRSGELLFKGIGNMVDNTVKVADTIIKADIDAGSREIRDEREDYQARLESARANPAKVAKMDGLLADTSPDMPDELGTLDSTLGNIKSGYASKKFGWTHYVGTLDKLASSMRSRYPGYVDYIDQKFNQVAGMDIANAKTNALLADIQAAANARASAQNKTLSLINSNNKLPQMDLIRERYMAGDPNWDDNAVFRHIAKYNNRDWQRSEAVANFNYMSQARTISEKQALDTIDTYMVTKVEDAFQTMVVGTALGANITPSQVFNVVNEYQQGLRPGMNQQDFVKIGHSLQAGIDRLERQAQSELSVGPIDKDGKTRLPSSRELAGDAGDKKIVTRLDPLKRLAASLVKGDLNAVSRIGNMLDAKQLDHKNDMLNDDMIAGYIRTGEEIKKSLGEQFMATLTNKWFVGEANTRLQQYVNVKTQEAVTGRPDTENTFNKIQGRPLTLKDHLKENADRNAASGNRLPELVAPRTTEQFVQQIKLLHDKDTPEDAKKKIADYFYHPGNKGILAQFAIEGSTNPNTGNIVNRGRYTTFRELTTKQSADEIKKLESKTQGFMKNFVNWAEGEFHHQLFKEDVLNLQKMVTDPGFSSRYKVAWSTDNKRFMLVDENGKDMLYGAGNFMPGVTRPLRRINDGISGLKNVYEASGDNIDAKLIVMLRSMGLDPRNQNVTGFQEEMLNAILGPKKAVK